MPAGRSLQRHSHELRILKDRFGDREVSCETLESSNFCEHDRTSFLNKRNLVTLPETVHA